MVLGWFRRHWLVYLGGALAMLASTGAQALVPRIVQWCVDVVSGGPIPQFLSAAGGAAGAWRSLLLLFVVVLLVEAVGRRYWRLTLGQETHRMAGRLKQGLWDRIRFLPRARLSGDLSPGVLMNVAAGDVGTARLIFGWTLIGLLDTGFLLTFAVVSMVLIDPMVTLAALGALAVLPAAARRTARTQASLHSVAQEDLGRLNELITQVVSTIRLHRLSRSGPRWTRRLGEVAEEYRRRRLEVVSSFLRLLLLISVPIVMSYGIVFLLGIPRVLRGEMTVGEFVALQGYILLLQPPLMELGFVSAEWQRGVASLGRIRDVLLAPVEAELRPAGGRCALVSGAPLWEIRNLTWCPPNGGGPVLDRLSFTLQRGEWLGVRGPVGSGKSTLIQILAGLEHRFTGEVRLGGRPIQEWPPEEVRRMVALVEQRPFLFADTVRANVALNQRLTDEDLWSLLSAVGLADEIRALPRRLDTQLGEWGINLSGGQKQRLTIARALARRAPVLLLDDCLSAVDTVTEEGILSRLQTVSAGVTVVWTAHRPSTLRRCTHQLELR